LDKLNLQASYLSSSTYRGDATLHDRKIAPSTASTRAHPAPSALKVEQSGPAATIEISGNTPDPPKLIPMSADRQIGAYIRNTKLL
jgi:hypothetical protein